MHTIVLLSGARAHTYIYIYIYLKFFTLKEIFLKKSNYKVDMFRIRVLHVLKKEKFEFLEERQMRKQYEEDVKARVVHLEYL